MSDADAEEAREVGQVRNSAGRRDRLDLEILLAAVPHDTSVMFLQKCLGNLDEADRELLDIYFASDMSLKDTADKLFLHKNAEAFIEVKKDDITVNIHGNIVTLREDNGSVYDLEISQQLADKLLKLSNTHIWNRRNRNSDGYEITIYGEYHDSCFKIEQRKEKGSAEQEVQRYRKVYLAWISKITSKYIGNSVRPLYIYVSGIMCRIKHIFEDDNTGFDLRFAFVENPRFRMTGILIEKELERCHYNKPRYQLNKMVNGYIDVFE